MANVRDSDTSLWLHNKLGTSNDSWISGSICSQLNKEVLRNIKECFPDLQTQVKLKLLLSFFHIPRRLVDEWKTELEEVIEVAGLDSELWVSMIAETMKTFPATSSLNTEISDYDETRPIFTDMVNDLRKLVNKHSDLGMLPLECQYLNKNALVSVVGQQPAPVKHFTLKRKPKSATLRQELLCKSADAQSSLKKTSAPTIPLRSRGMPRKMTDTTPLKGIPSRMPTTGFRSPNVPGNQQRPNLSRTPAGRKDGGIKIIELSEQPLGYAAAKKRKREQQLEEQQKKQEQKAAAAAAAASAQAVNAANAGNTSPIVAEANNAAETPTTPTSVNNNNNFEIKTEPQHNQSIDSMDEGHEEDFKTPDIVATVTKSEPSTPEYAATLTYAQATTPTQNKSPDIQKTPMKLSIVSTPKSTIATKVNNNNNNFNHASKRIKQEIEIKSEEIIVPANIKVEKIDTPVQSTTTTTTTLMQAMPHTQPSQRVIIQPSVQQVVIRSATQQQQKLHTQPTTSTTTIGGTTIKMEKLDIKPIVRSSTAVASTSTAAAAQAAASRTQTTMLTQQQLRQAVNPLANLPNNISVKITKTKSAATSTSTTGASTSQQIQQQTQTQQQPILINSSTPVILASSPSQTARSKQLAAAAAAASTTTTTTTTIPTQAIKNMPLSQIKTAANSGPVIISQTIIQPAKRVQQQQQQQPSTSGASTSSGAGTSQQAVQQQQQQQQPQLVIQQQQTTSPQQQQPQQTTTQYIITTPQTQQQQQQQQQQQTTVTLPTLTSFTQTRPATQSTTLYQTTAAAPTFVTAGGTPTKIVLKNSSVVMTPVRQQQQQQPQQQQATVVTSSNPPPLVATSAAVGPQQIGGQPTLLNIQNVQLPNRPVTIQPASQAAQAQHMQAQLQQQHPQHTIVSNTTATQQPKLSQQVIMQPAAASNATGTVSTVNVTPNKNKTIIFTQKGTQVILRNIGGDVYEQIPINNVSGLQSLTGAGTTLMTTTAAGPPSLVKTAATGVQPQNIQIQQQTNKQLPTLIPTNVAGGQHIIVQQQTPSNVIGNTTQQTIIRPVMTTLPQGLTLIQRPGQQPQLVQLQTTGGTGVPQRTIITQPATQQQQQLRTQQIVVQHKPVQQRIITNAGTAAQGGAQTQQIHLQTSPGNSRTVQLQVQQQHPQSTQQQQQQQQQQAPQRKGLSLSNEHVHKAHEMFRKANRVSRPDKALILGFMAGLRENPRPNSENVLVIKLGESEEKVQQEDGNTALRLVESHIRLDYNTGEWKTFQNYRLLDQSAAS